MNIKTAAQPRALDYLICGLLYCLPQHWISRLIYRLSRIQSRWHKPIMRWFIRHYQVDLTEAEPAEYTSFNAFFTRALHPTSRPIATEDEAIVSPVDGCVSQIGDLQQQRLIQAKNFYYTVEDLLGRAPATDSTDVITHFMPKRFATLYLSPRDYHRVHMPYSGTLHAMTYIPGRLYSVSPTTTQLIPRLFARNERVIAYFDSAIGPFAMVLVGAINVAAIETVWHGLVTPPHRAAIQQYDYQQQKITLAKGEEMGRFNLGSTVILLLGDTVQWQQNLANNSLIKMGEKIGSHLPED